ncbi:MAG: FAD-dependent oxidoreductase [Myxococcota bacterium]|nr:FAD-dependent oxidoreductase [Myxococcota bacterium]
MTQDTAASSSERLAGRAIAVIGGATAGAEMADRLAAEGAFVVVFEQNERPYGKVEDGLPRWHRELRHKEYKAIDAKLGQPNVAFVPRTKIGRDVDFAALCRDFGFHAVVLANGAWRDRPLPIDGADAHVGKGLVYQNPFIIWFNHENEKGFSGMRFEPVDDAIVVGGGLASIDVAKVMMLETTRAKLRERGIDEPMIDLEVKGIPRVLERHGLRFEDLGLKGATLFYRRRIEDMPVVEVPDGADDARRARVEATRKKLLDKAMERYLFRIEALSAPDGLIVEGGRLVGLRFRRTKMENGKLTSTDETFERRGAIVISSIGSIPEAIPGIDMKGELFAFSDWDLGRLDAYPNVFSAGNVVTGKGNIAASRKHAGHVAEEVIAAFLGVGERGHVGEEAVLDAARAETRAKAETIAKRVAEKAPHDAAAMAKLRDAVRALQQRVGHDGDYAAWIARVTPADLE